MVPSVIMIRMKKKILKPGNLSERNCYSVNETGILGRKTSEC